MAKKSKSKLKEKLKKASKATGFAVLIPFKSLMIKILNKKGIKHDNTIKDVAIKFYENVLKKDFETETAIVKFEDLVENLTDVAVDAIVKAIISFIKNIKKKKDEGKPMTDIENDIAEGMKKIEEKIKEEAKEEAQLNIGKWLTKPQTLFIISILVTVIITLLSRKK